MSQKCGDDLARAGVKLQSVYAATEFGAVSAPYLPEVLTEEDDRTPLDWEWIKFHDRPKLRWAPLGDGSYECQFLVSGVSASTLHLQLG